MNDYDRQCLVRDTLWLFEQRGGLITRAVVEQQVREACEADDAGDGHQLFVLANEVWSGIVEYVRDHGIQAATASDREIVLDAMMRVESGYWLTGREACPRAIADSEAGLTIVTIEQRGRLAGATAAELRERCRVILSSKIEQQQRTQQYIAVGASVSASRAAQAKNGQREYMQRAGRELRARGVVAKQAVRSLGEQPYRHADGTVVQVTQDQRIEASRNGQRVGMDVSPVHFGKIYMPTGRGRRMRT